MFGGVALSSATANTWPIWPAVTVNGLGVAMSWACGGRAGRLQIDDARRGAVEIDEGLSAGSTPGAIAWRHARPKSR